MHQYNFKQLVCINTMVDWKAWFDVKHVVTEPP
jgi:hypothetical protein